MLQHQATSLFFLSRNRNSDKILIIDIVGNTWIVDKEIIIFLIFHSKFFVILLYYQRIKNRLEFFQWNKWSRQNQAMMVTVSLSDRDRSKCFEKFFRFFLEKLSLKTDDPNYSTLNSNKQIFINIIKRNRS